MLIISAGSEEKYDFSALLASVKKLQGSWEYSAVSFCADWSVSFPRCLSLPGFSRLVFFLLCFMCVFNFPEEDDSIFIN